MQHYAILVDNHSNIQKLTHDLIHGVAVYGLEQLQLRKGALFSRSEIDRFLHEEEFHDLKILTSHTQQTLQSMSSGEQKKILLRHLLKKKPDFLLLVNPYDNLDRNTQKNLRATLAQSANQLCMVQILSRKADILPFTSHFATLQGENLTLYDSEESFNQATQYEMVSLDQDVPPPLHSSPLSVETLVLFNGVEVSYDGKPVLKRIDWTIKKGEFWQLVGPNGSGKTTLLSMITGDNHKGYGQDLYLFGHKKGSGESVWDLKGHIGYFTPSMTDKFRGYHSLENMIISGLYDSIGLYYKPTDVERRLARNWLSLLGLEAKADQYFHQLSRGDKRLIMTARAMIKHPPLLLLDEPTAGLDDRHAQFFVALVNKIARGSETAIVFVSHRPEENLRPNQVFELIPTANGSVGKIHYI